MPGRPAAARRGPTQPHRLRAAGPEVEGRGLGRGREGSGHFKKKIQNSEELYLEHDVRTAVRAEWVWASLIGRSLGRGRGRVSRPRLIGERLPEAGPPKLFRSLRTPAPPCSTPLSCLHSFGCVLDRGLRRGGARRSAGTDRLAGCPRCVPRTAPRTQRTRPTPQPAVSGVRVAGQSEVQTANNPRCEAEAAKEWVGPFLFLS